ncbi:hypothetical protein Tcan_11736 [Toxocara canis]|uniref:Methyltransferase FkbM domain-containing protein n=1 Tax=Toxocara canis TaxID=6265 RepID=A0A0B2UWL6_TOXCA|nr:hypothetical protein Tcan_11736 [Toxocara canis]
MGKWGGMRYCNSLLVLRILTVSLALLVGRDYYLLVGSLIYLWTTLRNAVEYPEPSSMPAVPVFSWDDVDLLSPPALNDSLAEALRVNELLARPQYRCDKAVRIGSERFGFLICYDDDFTEFNSTIGEVLLLSGDVFEDGSFAKSLNPKRWTVFIPENYAGLDQIQGVDVEVNYLMRLRDAEDWSLHDIINGIANKQFGSAFLSFYSPLISSPDNGGIDQLFEAPRFIAEVLPFLRTKQLQIVAKIEKENAREVILGWYRLFYRLFFTYNFALLSAEADGNCGRMLDKCRYRLSFVHFEGHAFEAPVFGLGSPIEERSRLIRYLKTVDADCNCTLGENHDFDLPLLHKEIIVRRENCVFVYIRYREMSSKEMLNALGPCELYYFSPLRLNIEFDSSVHIFQFGLSPLANQSIIVPGERYDEQWKLLELSEIVGKTEREQIDAVILDLNGGEWDVLEAILNSPGELKRIQQLSIRLRLWIGEENENYRRFYYQLMQLNAFGFRKLYYKSDNDTTHYILFAKRSSSSQDKL